MAFDLDAEPPPTIGPVVLRSAAIVLVNSTQPLLVDLLRYHGGAEPTTLLYLLPTYLGMVFVGLASKTKKSIWNEKWGRASLLCLCDMLHQISEKAGLVFAGSAAYTITASWSTVWTALLSLLILRKQLRKHQWLGILLICIGFSVKAVQINFTRTNYEAIGILLTLFASILHGLSFVLNEKYMTGEHQIDGPNLVGMCGMISSTAITTWILIWTVPQWDVRVRGSIARSGGSIPVVVTVHVALFLLSVLRSATLWYLLKHVGAVSSGILKGARTAIVFLLSHVLYCHLQESQCMTSVKALSVVLCVSGVLVYSIGDRLFLQGPFLPLKQRKASFSSPHAASPGPIACSSKQRGQKRY
ncbi:transporter/permease protein [Toxoplasma gondii TgCatPRC2]|uniref:Transporter/permease protein n=12 Tax=Toxoplasma gondii TaxID=5811 RepID=A0A125YZ39_TOXGV|nr:transporter/permease protein [Toxoplasma gondii GT1]ESS30353.1 transporter/permease protein [Toxoplasma gondii VEG]KAF4645377.1 transporter/permease protein [Toxoplasma gondii]KFG35570.1 transporter/permease protein [Toxoplasma gondii GAB2-2007-GAL-DOM2]KFG47022.1 transporter/permease protein [Toxoplasma gondii p89]KFG52932.1 transporter/permease protein [Toxoplasma gondii FOU]KFG60079.1 transporter/permease protein [Toxoplasma gondii RUB]KFH06547.1 transporter/permease protein [Toxoplasm